MAMAKKTKNKNIRMLNAYNNKRVIIITEYNGTDERVVPLIEKGIQGTIRTCNSIQKDIKLQFFSLQDEGKTSIGIMIHDDCPYADETVKEFFTAQMATFSGLFFDKFDSLTITG